MKTDVERASGVHIGQRLGIDGAQCIVTDVRWVTTDENGVPTFEISTRPVTEAD